MTDEERIIHQGDRVFYLGKLHRVNSVKLGLIAGPHYRLTCEHGIASVCDAQDGLTSTKLIATSKLN